MFINVKLKDEKVNLPKYQSEGAAGFDLEVHSFLKIFNSKEEVDIEKIFKYSLTQGYITLRPFERVLVGTGLYMSIPSGYQLEIRDRSGSDYRGEIGVILANLTNGLVKINIGERVAQGVLTQYSVATFDIVDDLDSTDRNDGGFGSTGII